MYILIDLLTYLYKINFRYNLICYKLFKYISNSLIALLEFSRVAQIYIPTKLKHLINFSFRLQSLKGTSTSFKFGWEALMLVGKKSSDHQCKTFRRVPTQIGRGG